MQNVRGGSSDVLQVLDSGEEIEQYPEDTPFPSVLLLARVGGRPLHVVAATDAASNVKYMWVSNSLSGRDW